MNPLIRHKKATLLRLIVFALGCSALLPNAQAVLPFPPPDGGYPGGNTAEGQDALLSLTTGTFNTANGFLSLKSNTTGNFNTALGAGALLNNTADLNTATGAVALLSNTTGTLNTANGEAALFFNTTGNQNTATGAGALQSNTTGNRNTAIGSQALFGNTTGSLNIGLGRFAGARLTTGDSNIDIGNSGVPGESATIRIGTAGNQTTTFVAGISGTAVTGTAVVVDGNGQLGVAPSSKRFKMDIKSMDMASEAILALRPVTFRYKEGIDPNRTPQFGLVAEEVERVNPDLVSHDAKGNPYTVRYDAVNAMLLNEFLKEHRKVEQLTKDFESKLAVQQKQIEALSNGLQKVSAQIEASKPAPQVVNNP
jgi:hypothetical protein